MADNGGKIHELKVAIRVALEGYKKDMAAIKNETKKVKDAVNSETSKINSVFSKISTQKAEKEVAKITSQLDKQKERIAQQENVIRKLKSQYEELTAGVAHEKSVSGLEKQLRSAEKELEKVNKKYDATLAHYEQAGLFAAGGNDHGHLAELEKQLDEIEPRYDELRKRVKLLKEELAKLKMNPEASASAQDLAAKIEVETKKLERLKNEAGTTKEKLDAVLHSTSPPTVTKKISQINSKIKELIKNSQKSSSKMSSGFQKIENAITKVKKRITGLMGSVLVFQLLRQGITAVKEQLGNCLKTNAEFSALLNTIKTNLSVTFASIYTAVLPAINMLMAALAALTGALAGIVSGIFGKTYSESLLTAKGLKQATAAAAGYNSETKKGQTFSFDEFHNIQKDDSSAVGSSLMGPTVGLEEAEGLVDRIKSFLSDFFAPLKEAWDANGASVIESTKFALEAIKTLIGDIGKSFMEVWTNGTGYQVCSDILLILSNVLMTIGLIATGLDKAWNFNNTGTAIIQDLFNILLNVLDALARISEAAAVWSAGLDFVPILTSFENLLAVLDSLTSTICDGLVWMYENVLLPFAGWTIEDAIPAFFELLASVIGLVNSVLETFEPLGLWLWESFLEPIAQWTGGMICEVLETLAGLLTELGDWITEHQAIMEGIAITLGSVAVAVELVNAAVLIWNIIAAIATGVTTAFSAAIAFITSPVGIVIAIIAALVAIGVTLYKNWDTIKDKTTGIWNAVKTTIVNVVTVIKTTIANTLENVKKTWENVWTSCKTTVVNIFNGVWSTILNIMTTVKNGISNMLTSIKTIWGNIWTNCKTTVVNIFNGVWSTISNIMTTVKNGISNMLTSIKIIWGNVWTSCKTTVVNIFNGIWSAIRGVINSILGGVESMSNGVINGVNGVIKALNGLRFDIPDWVPGFGGKTFGFSIPTLSTVSLPRLAKGGIVDKLTPLIAGEAGKEAIVPLENNTGWIDQISSRISDFINVQLADQEGSGDFGELNISIPITLELDGDTLLKKLIKVYKKRGYPIVVEGV